MPTSVCTAKASYKKISGVLELNDSHLQWTQDGKKAPSVRVPLTDAASLFCSKEGAAQVRLKLGLFSDDNGHNFTFISPQAVAYSEREKFKKELTTIIGRNRTAAENAAKPPVTALNASNLSTPKPTTVPPSRASSSRAASVTSDTGISPIIPGNDPASDFRLRKTVLLNNPDLASLHRELVIGGQITESEFWEGREHLLYAQVASEQQRKGKPGQLVDPRPETVEGETKIRITPQLVHDIFDEYPVVAKAYNDNVPNKLSEAEFWKRYFQSKLFNAHRASIRSSATQHVVKEDPIFDKYLEKDDDELEPRRQRDIDIDMLLNLGATREDHEETGNEQDITMRAGKQKGALPLIRKFNEHSERLLNSALGEGPSSKRRRIDDTEYEAIDLDDLHDPEASIGIALEMQDRQRYFEGRMANASADESQESLDTQEIIQSITADLQQWASKLTQLKIERKPGDAALMSMTQNVAARLDVKSKRNDIPEALFRQMRTCQTAANEFLRQFWTATYPPITDGPSLTTPAQRAAKASKMIGYLSKTPEKVAAIVQTAKQQGVDPGRVEVAMKPVLDAVDRALAFQRNKKMSRP
ncbi:RNA polymerase II transcription factor B subunit 1 [Stygiomarasmius scandens]|uniref:RNA polymerase II transcription factor B subunit 1 n=1 Tax=Marasmiellus scandens TaxID=2682957 RepID=A0ABR1K5M3_9AGAR